MNQNVLGFGFLFLFVELCYSQPNNEPGSNGHIPDYAPEFTPRRVYGVHLRIGLQPSEDYGPIPSDDVNERNRIVNLLPHDVSPDTAGAVYVFDLYETNDPAMKTTVNGFLCGENEVHLLLRKTADSKYEKISYERILTNYDLILLQQNNQQE